MREMSGRLHARTRRCGPMPESPDRDINRLDRLVIAFDRTLRGAARVEAGSVSESPAGAIADDALDDGERRHSAGLMRVNHAGEVAAQALYQGQSLVARDPGTRAAMEQAAHEENDHLVWCRTRLEELDSEAESARPALVRRLPRHRCRRRTRGRSVEPGIRGRDRAPGGGAPRRSSCRGFRTATAEAAPCCGGCRPTSSSTPRERAPRRRPAAPGRAPRHARRLEGHDPHRLLDLRSPRMGVEIERKFLVVDDSWRDGGAGRNAVPARLSFHRSAQFRCVCA